MTTPTQDRQSVAKRRVEEAAVAATALYAASKVVADPVEAIKRITLSAAAMTATASATASAAIVALWRRTNPYDDTSVAEFAAAAGKLVISAQRATATVHSAAQLSQLRALGINANVTVKIPDQVRGATVEFGRKVTVTAPATTALEYRAPVATDIETGDRTAERAESRDPVETVTRQVRHADSAPERLFQRAAVTYRYERSTGADHDTANEAAEQRIEGLVETNVMLAQRLAEQQTLAQVVDLDQEILGYRRVIHPELSKSGSCGLCIAASDLIYSLAELKPIHDECNCTIAAVTEDHDPGHRINEDDLKMLYSDAGSTSGRSKGNNLKRTRYTIEAHSELGAVLTRVSKDPGEPRKSAPRNRTDVAPRRSAASSESAASKAARLLPGFEKSLATALDRNLAEDSRQVLWLRGQISKLTAANS